MEKRTPERTFPQQFFQGPGGVVAAPVLEKYKKNTPAKHPNSLCFGILLENYWNLEWTLECIMEWTLEWTLECILEGSD